MQKREITKKVKSDDKVILETTIHSEIRSDILIEKPIKVLWKHLPLMNMIVLNSYLV